jgi:hypothetical protein
MENELTLLQVDATHRFLVNAHKQPFFWLGDTAWELLHRLDLEESRYYFEDRKSKGFNVIQTVILAELDGLNTPNAYREKPLINNDPTKPNEAYFNHVDAVVQLAGQLGIYLGLLPTWGDKYNKKWGIGPEVFTPDNAEIFGRFLGNRYKDAPNIVWVLGGDRIPDDEEDYLINCRMAKSLRSSGGGHLISLHPMGGHIASDIFGQEAWLDIDMFQSRHQKGFKEFKLTRKAIKNRPKRPVIDAEPGYENIPNLLNKLQLQRLNDYDIRKAAYWNMLCGAAGHTYGCNELWQIYSEDKRALHGAHLHWREALTLPGATQMGYMKRFFESLPWQTLKPSQELLAGFNWKNRRHITVMADMEMIILVAYSPAGRTIRWAPKILKCRNFNAYWFDPTCGRLTEKGQVESDYFPVPNKEQDWLLLVIAEDEFSDWKPNLPLN